MTKPATDNDLSDRLVRIMLIEGKASDERTQGVLAEVNAEAAAAEAAQAALEPAAEELEEEPKLSPRVLRARRANAERLAKEEQQERRYAARCCARQAAAASTCRCRPVRSRKRRR